MSVAQMEAFDPLPDSRIERLPWPPPSSSVCPRMPPSGSRSLLGLGCQNCSRLRTPQWEIAKGPGGCMAPAGAKGEGTVPGTCPMEAEAARPQGSSTRWQL